MTFTFQGQTYEDPVVLVEDREGEQMPYHPEFRPEDFETLPSDLTAWNAWWCACGHLVMDHHVDDQSRGPELTMGCWAKDCACRIGFS